jgi:hypothetical protein
MARRQSLENRGGRVDPLEVRLFVWQPPGAQALVGVYDNLGLEWFHGWDSGRPDSAEPADFLIVANAERDPR